MSLAPRRSSSPIRKPSRPTGFVRNLTRAATYPSIVRQFPISPNSCFTDDNALEQLLSHSLPVRPSSPSSVHHMPISPAASDVTQFPFLLQDPAHPPNATDVMSNNHSHRQSSTGNGNNNNTNTNNRTSSNNNSNRNNSRNTNTNNTVSRSNNRRRRSSSSNNNNESSTRRRTTTPNSSLQCNICHQYYSRRDNLRAHQRVHTGDRPYQCRFCAQRFRWLGALRNHEANHERDGDRPLNPPPPGARQPAGSSSRQSSSSSSRQALPRSAEQRSRSHHQQHQPSSSRTYAAQPSSSSHRTQRSAPPQQRRSHPSVPNLELDLDSTHGAPHRHVLVTEGEPQVSPLYTGSQETWDLLDDIPEDRTRD